MNPNTDKCHLPLSKKIYNLWMQVDTECKIGIMRNFFKLRLKNCYDHFNTVVQGEITKSYMFQSKLHYYNEKEIVNLWFFLDCNYPAFSLSLSRPIYYKFLGGPQRLFYKHFHCFTYLFKLFDFLWKIYRKT